jgi:pimeloyl-ACP methyl ester carboxylesterase
LGALSLALILTISLIALYFHLVRRYLGFLLRVFDEKPLLIAPKGQPVPDAEEVRFPTSDGLQLCGCYLRGRREQRRGVIFFGLEFGSNRWGCLPYCEFLLEDGYDVFAFESRGQGDSDSQPDYEPSQWVTHYEVRDVKAALAYLRGRPDAVPSGIGFFGISKGGSAGLIASIDEPYVQCFVTDGIFATRSTMVPYMRRWVSIVSSKLWIQKLLPSWYYGIIADTGLRRMTRDRGCQFPHLERALSRLSRRPLFMIHGGADTYITPSMARKLFRHARTPKELWIVEGAKHNQALRTAGEEYPRRILEFFHQHLQPPPEPHHGSGTSQPARDVAHQGNPAAVNGPRHKQVRPKAELRAPVAPTH